MRKKVLIALRMAGIAGQDKLSGIFRRLGRDHDWDIHLIRTAEAFTPACVQAALSAGFDGFILSIPDTESAAALLAKSAIPTIVMDLHDPALAARASNIVFIRNSSEEIGRAAANHLLNIGRCRSYAFVHNPEVLEWSVDRVAAFRHTLNDHGLWGHELSAPEGLKRLERPVGVLAANDTTGFDVLEYGHTHRLRVPEDLLVIGINNDTIICENARPPLTSIQPDFEQEGFLAAELLDAMMTARRNARKRHDTPARTFYVGIKSIVRRESTGKLVQKAVAYIRKHACKGISVEGVIPHLGCSRRLAELRFRELQGATIGETIISTRLGEVRRLLVTTKLPLETIAAACGYANPNYLKNLFKRRFGMTMRDFRRGEVRINQSSSSDMIVSSPGESNLRFLPDLPAQRFIRA